MKQLCSLLSVALLVVAGFPLDAGAWLATERGSYDGMNRLGSGLTSRIFFTASGDVVAAGAVEETARGENLTLVRYRRSDGTRLWRRVIEDCHFPSRDAFAPPGGDYVVKVRCKWDPDHDGDIDGTDFLVGISGSDGFESWRLAPVPAVGKDFWDFQAANNLTPDGNLVVFYEQRILKVDLQTGSVLRDVQYPAMPPVTWLGADPAGNPVGVAASTNELFRVSEADGSVLSIQPMASPPGIPPGYLYAQDPAGHFIIANDPTFDTDEPPAMIDVVKRSLEDGTVLWNYETRGDSPLAESAGDIRAATVDAIGNVVAVGGIANKPLPTDKGTLRWTGLAVKLDAATGAEIWRHEFGAPITVVYAVAVAGGGDVYVAASPGDYSGAPHLVIRLDADDGHEIWRREVPSQGTYEPAEPWGTACRDMYIATIAVDPGTGNVAFGGSLCTPVGAAMFTQVLTAGGGEVPCGDAIVDAGEACDDGNAFDCDGCSSTCRIEFGPACGDGLTNPACGEQCDDLGNVDGDGCSSTCQDEATTESVNLAASAGASVTTDTEGDGATPADPVETTLTSPLAGNLAIEETSNVTTSSLGFSLLSQQINITAPEAEADRPLVIDFIIDATRIPAEETPYSIELLKDSVPVVDCSGAAGIAEPDPCIAARAALTGGDAQITVLSSTASDWNPGAIAGAVRLPVRGQRMLIKDDDVDLGKRKIQFALADPAIAAVDPTCGAADGGGATLEVFGGAGTGHKTTLELPCSNWSVFGRPGRFKGYRYQDTKQLAGPCKSVTLLNPRKPGTGSDGKIKALCSNANPAHPLEYDLTADGEYAVGLTLEIGPVTFCSAFPRRPGTEAAPNKNDNNEVFKGLEVAPPAACWVLD